ncbi:hypothetical protein [Asaia bogorensis]|uniref:Uncharacterized protein n=1 Tax=Asaia bogorensis NBRC 16594 TaxID=1231624 RepID=A0AAN4U2R2_9PROT|nr:hypothetical protein [Asaia bogorensis]BAT20776.1 hypothetical protein Asbog_02522 [Asaia bogorensis NBRC 16594]GBQ75941.1 hypothetical protein AA0311_1013 [Asaia bogorensis NBRC 16594]GEL53786.1 hypothetical protein ABO01nite_17930 [Asaia bogorensis NBRC 16594]
MTNAEAFLKTAQIDGETIGSLYDQWLPQELISLADDITCVTFSDALSDRKAVWYFNESREYCGSHVEVVQRLQPSDILSSVSPWFDALFRNALSATPSALGGARPLPLFLATQLAAAWSVRMMADLRQVQTALIEQDREIARVDDKPLSARDVRRLLGARIGPETLVVLSPFSGAPLRSQISFVVDHQLIHRFYDPELDCAFYLAWWERQLDAPPSFYCPKANVVVSDETLAGMLPSLILGWYLGTPEHAEMIAQAQAFEARDYGLGKASSLMSEVNAPSAPLPAVPDAASADMISESWAFLHQHQPAGHSPADTSKDPKPSGKLIDRLRSLVKKK